VSQSSRSKADEVDGGWRLHGRKMFASMFEASDYCYLYVHPRENPNPGAALGVLIETKQDGIAVTDLWDTIGMRATRSNQVDYDGAFVPDELVLYETENFVESFIIQEANWSFGGYTSYRAISTGVPSGRIFESRVMSRFAMRMQPWLTSWPSSSGWFVPCRPISPFPPAPNCVSTVE
jgi:hypothetical protein